MKRLVLLFVLFSSGFLLAQDSEITGIVDNFFNQLSVILLPIIVWLAGIVVNWLKIKFTSTGGFGGTIFVTLLVPISSYLASLVYDLLLNPDLPFLSLFGLGLLGTFINELIKQWQQSISGNQTKVGEKKV